MFKKKPLAAVADPRCLVVEVIEARNLIASTKAGDSDPHLALYLTDIGMREIKTESFKTKPQTKTLAPKWRETFSFGEQRIPRDNICLQQVCNFSNIISYSNLQCYFAQARSTTWTLTANCRT